MSNRRLVPLNVVALPTLPVGGHRPGDLVYNETDGNLYVSDGAAWTNLGGGSSGPYSSAEFADDFAAQSTDGLTEGTTNLYFTDARAVAATASEYDPAGSAAAAQASAQSYADGLAVNYDPAGSSAAAQSAAESYADGLAVNYDPAGAAAAAQLAAESYADTAAATAVTDLVAAAPETLDTLNELAAALGDDPNFATTVTNQIAAKADASDLTAHESSTTSVHGIADTAALETQTGAQAKADAAAAAAEAYADSLAVDYDPAGSASAAQTAAQSYADSLAVNYDPAGSASAAETAANAYTDNAIAGFDALPDQTGHAGEYLTTDGTDTAWGTVDALPDQTGHTGEYLTTDGTSASWTSVSSTSAQFDVRYYPPDNPTVGTCYFDRSLNAPVWWDGTAWWHPGMAVTTAGGTASTTFLDTLDGGAAGTSYASNLAVIDGGTSTP